MEERQFAEDEGQAGLDQLSVDKGTDDVDGGNAAWQELQHSHAGKIAPKVSSLKHIRNYNNLNEKSKYVLVIMLGFF